MKLQTILIFVITAFVLILAYQTFHLRKKLDNVELRLKEVKKQPEKEEKPVHDVADYMHKLQVFSNKLYFAGMEKNQPLVDFYVHELEEVMEEVAEGGIVDEGVDISTNMKSFGVQQLETFETLLNEEGLGTFEKNYESLISSCNNCHMVTKHPFIVIKIPETIALDNQEYSMPTE